jgi:hypothetical protein
MDFMITVNIWFIVSLCLLFLVIGLLAGGRVQLPGQRGRY